jgi:Ca2+-binding EF-hand superfamily protein
MATADQKTALIAAFDAADTDNDGHLSQAEITAVLTQHGIADANGDGKIQKEEWTAFCNAL